jgi:hypothetical protein
MKPICATNDECESLVANIEFESGVRTVPPYHSRVVYPREKEENCTGQRVINRCRQLALALASCHSS